MELILTKEIMMEVNQIVEIVVTTLVTEMAVQIVVTTVVTMGAIVEVTMEQEDKLTVLVVTILGVATNFSLHCMVFHVWVSILSILTKLKDEFKIVKQFSSLLGTSIVLYNEQFLFSTPYQRYVFIMNAQSSNAQLI